MIILWNECMSLPNNTDLQGYIYYNLNNNVLIVFVHTQFVASPSGE